MQRRRQQQQRERHWKIQLIPRRTWRRSILPVTRPPKRVVLAKGETYSNCDAYLSLNEFRSLVHTLTKNCNNNDNYNNTNVITSDSFSRYTRSFLDAASAKTPTKETVCISCLSIISGKRQRTESKRTASNSRYCTQCGIKYVNTRQCFSVNDNNNNNNEPNAITNALLAIKSDKCMSKIIEENIETRNEEKNEDEYENEKAKRANLRDYFNCTLAVYVDRIYTPHSPIPEECVDTLDDNSTPYSGAQSRTRTTRENNYDDLPSRAQILVPPPNLYTGDLARRVLQTVEEVLGAMLEGKNVYLDREHQCVVTETSIDRRINRYHKRLGGNDTVSRVTTSKKKLLKKCVKLSDPIQKAMGYLRVMGSRFIDKCKYGKDNQIRRQILGRVINGCSRKTVGTSGELPAGYAVLPSKVLRTLGEPQRPRSSTLTSSYIGNIEHTSANPFRIDEKDSLLTNNDRRRCRVTREIVGNDISGSESNFTLEKFNENVYGEGNAIRYPVIDKLNIAYAQLIPGGNRWTADVPSSQFKYNGGDNDGDAFNFERFTNGLLANSAYENRVSTAPAFNMCNNGQLKMEFDSDAKLGLGTSITTVITSPVSEEGKVVTKNSSSRLTTSTKTVVAPRWKYEMNRLRTQFFATGNSFDIYKQFIALESYGRERSRFGGVFSLHDYAKSIPSGALKKLIETQSVSRLSMAHFIHSTRTLGQLQFPYNDMPVKRDLKSSNLLSGLKPSDFAASSQATFDALADQKSAEMSLQGNLQYQFQYVLRPMILSADRRKVFNPVTKKIIAANASSLFAITRADADNQLLVKAALDFARLAIGLQPLYSRDMPKNVAVALVDEAAQYKNFIEKSTI